MGSMRNESDAISVGRRSHVLQTLDDIAVPMSSVCDRGERNDFGKRGFVEEQPRKGKG